MRKIEAWVRTTKEKYIDYFWHLEKVNNLRDAFTVSKKKKGLADFHIHPQDP